MQSIIKLPLKDYEFIAGFDWPNYNNYLTNDYIVSDYIQSEIRSFEREFKYPLNNVERLIGKHSHSQAGQDFFVIGLLQGKLNGTYLEIGASHPSGGNNTFLLDTMFGFTGSSIEINQNVVNDWNQLRPQSNLQICDALTFDYTSLPTHFDYLQIDIEPQMNNLRVLEKVLKSQTFSVITFEHDVWRNTQETQFVMNESRKLLLNYGYELVVNNVTILPGEGKGIGDEPIHFEDWYANPKYIKQEIINAYQWLDYSNNPKYRDDIHFKK
jgi:hypothetical protein